MNTLVKILQATAQLVLLLALIGMVAKIFFRKSLFGRFLLCFIKELFNGLKTTYGIVKYLSKHGYKGTKAVVKFVTDHYKTFKEKESQKEVVNGEVESLEIETINNVIDLNTFKQLRHKWDK